MSLKRPWAGPRASRCNPSTSFCEAAGPSVLKWRSDSPGFSVTPRILAERSVRRRSVGRVARGNTCLPVRAEYACSVRRRFQTDPHTSVLLFDFSGSIQYNRRKVGHDSHDWGVYMRRDDINDFLDALLTDKTVQDESARICA